MQIFAGVSTYLQRGVKRKWDNRERRFFLHSLAICSETLELNAVSCKVFCEISNDSKLCDFERRSDAIFSVKNRVSSPVRLAGASTYVLICVAYFLFYLAFRPERVSFCLFLSVCCFCLRLANKDIHGS